MDKAEIYIYQDTKIKVLNGFTDKYPKIGFRISDKNIKDVDLSEIIAWYVCYGVLVTVKIAVNISAPTF